MALKPVKVSQLNGYIRRILQTDPILGNVSVIGEISNLKYHSSGHIYFTLKDEASKINCFLGMDYAQSLRYQLSDGMEVTASGFVSVYEKGGTYSLFVRNIAVEGLGNLSIAFEKLKQKLEKEGLFSPERKKKLPAFPKTIGILTSPTGAAVRDIIKIITARNQYVDIFVYPCLVQGPEAAGDLAAAIHKVNQMFSHTDILIVGRGGGSMEELWPFNEEIVARSIFESQIPIISAVGHETDFTIADFAADVRAETPTAAAQLAVPNIEDLKRWSQTKLEQLNSGLHRKVQYLEAKVQQNRKEELLRALKSRITMAELSVSRAKEKLDAFNPVSIMGRGYCVALTADGKLLSNASDISIDDMIFLRLMEGTLECQVKKITKDKLEHQGKESS